ncbi:RecF/RecN/SMC protein [Exidia glandulosa HHB12029]|uniref:Structural maintenance of chromosomes protein n=1 Tax=Exidia glandulosa HHB12029 TaxID=1314781 RepID=A0A165FDL3_EXIGL|nr:RecF/RecN/SMC protein [Exidia glandulosa HHB12029]
MPPRRTARAASSTTAAEPAPKTTRKRKAAAPTDESGNDTDTSVSRPRRAARSVSVVSDNDDDDDDVDATPVKKPARKPRAKKAAAVDSDDDQAMFTPKPAAKSARKKKAPVPPPTEPDSDDVFTPKANRKMAESTPKATPTPVPEIELDSEDESFMASGGPPKQRVKARQETASVVEESEEEDIDMSETRPPVPPPQPAAKEPEEPQGPRARLIIHKLVLVNFKSYAGRQEIGPFHKSFSAIVGPNGSGKSNTIDALLFVFGYRASKMRQGKLSELIHNSAAYPDLQECSVEVHFREIIDLPGANAAETVPGSSLTVTRTAFKNNSSKYTINGATSNFKEVTGLLKGKGIDLDHNRFLILQGEVESIAQMKPKAPSEHEDGLLEYLEDIIGTSHYKERIDAALVEVDRCAEDRADKLARLKIVEKEKAKLEEGKREAEDYIRTQNEWVRARSRLVQWQSWQVGKQREAASTTVEETKRELQEETERHGDDVAEAQDLEAHYEERLKLYEEVKKHSAAIMKNLGVHEKQEVGLEERKKHAAGKAKKLKKSIQDDSKAKLEAERTIEDSDDKIVKNQTSTEEYEASLEQEEKALEAITDSLRGKTQVFHDQIETKQKELEPFSGQINKIQATLDIARSERDLLVQKAEEARSAAKAAEAQAGELKLQRTAKETEMEDLKRDGAALAREKKSSDAKLQQLRSTIDDLRSRASSSRQKVDEAKASLAQNTSQNAVLDSLTRLKNAGRINGFHGRLGSLGTIPDKYDVAVTTACGALNHLVVDTVDQAQACIDYLRKNSVGRASFMVLEKLPNNPPPRDPTPENVPRLFDLIKPREARFAPAFYKAVSQTLVADDMEQANRVAFGGSRRWRVVTLAGQLIDASGTMSGGGGKVSRGGMSAKLAPENVSPDVMRRYEKESEDAARALDDRMREAAECEAECEKLAQEGPRVEMRMQKAELDLNTLVNRIAEAEKRVRELRAQSKPDAGDAARIKALEAEIVDAEKELAKAKTKAGKIEEEIQALEKKILDIGGSKLLAQKAKVDGIKLHLQLASDEITKAEVAKARAQKDLQKLASGLKAHEKSLAEAESDLAELEEQWAECARVLKEMREKVEEAQAAAESAKEDLDGIKQDLDEKQAKLRKFREREMMLQQRLEDAEKEMDEHDRNLQRYKLMHDELRLEDIDDEDEEDEEQAPPATDATDAPQEGEQGEQGEAMEVDPEAEDVKPNVKKLERARENPLELRIYTEPELMQFNKRELVADTTLLEERLKNARPNMNILKEYRKREEEFLKRAQDLEVVTAERDKHKKIYDELGKARLDEFMSGFNIISSKLKEMYQTITFGGNAELELVDSMDPFSEGIIFSVMPPKKSWKNISNLSGGEKTLSSLALVFALHVFKPTPLYFMDEIDAALDFRNVSIVANYIKDRTKNAQFIIISLRNDMFELSHRLVGIYKTSNATRSVCIDNTPLSVAVKG